jgi:hypothetical protein
MRPGSASPHPGQCRRPGDPRHVPWRRMRRSDGERRAGRQSGVTPLAMPWTWRSRAASDPGLRGHVQPCAGRAQGHRLDGSRSSARRKGCSPASAAEVDHLDEVLYTHRLAEPRHLAFDGKSPHSPPTAEERRKREANSMTGSQ